ncbi:MAG: DUF6531 domain-containing protein [Candidatus Electrothrix communis]|nr:MAG: DUF6531 domain-containing protein [Candidatus Electrothrix communis]
MSLPVIRALRSLFLPLLIISCALSGCSDDNVKVELTGQIDRSLPAGMTVCLDSSGNGRCDADEPSARTNADGTYSVTIPAESLGQFPLVVEPTQKAKPPVIALSAPAGKHQFVSPVSTAVQSRVYLGNSLAEAEADVRVRYALPKDVDLYADYQGGSLEPEPVHALLEAVASDYGFDVAGNTETAEVAADAQRVAGRRVSGARAASSSDNWVAVEVAGSPSFAAASVVESGSGIADSTVVAESGDAEDSALLASAEDKVFSVAAAASEAAVEAVVVSAEADCTPVIEHTGNGNLPDNVKIGSAVRFSWYVKNSSDCEVKGYRLKMLSISPERPATFSDNVNLTFDLAPNETDKLVEADMLVAPMEGVEEGIKYRVEFDIVTDTGEILEVPEDWERLYATFTVYDPSAEPTTLLAPENNTQIEGTKPILEWEPVSGAEVYRVVLSENSSFSGLSDDGVSTTTCLDDTCQTERTDSTTFQLGTSLTVETGKTYYWKVRDNASARWSSVFQFTVEENVEPPPVEPPEPWECSEREPLYDNWETPASGLGPDFVQTWGLVNNTNCEMNGFTIGNPEVFLWTGGNSYVPYPASISGTYTPFSLLPNGGTGQVTANFHFELPAEGIYRIFFDIITESGDVLPYLPSSTAPGYGRLYSDVGRSIGGCFAPAPAINSVDHVGLGNGKVVVSAEVENVSEDPSLMTNNNESTLESGSNGNYNGGDDADKADSTNKIEVVGECDQDAFLEYFYHTTRSDLFGKNCKSNACGGSVKFIGDPVNTAIGNFIQQETDAAVAGPGDSTIRLQRIYNSQAVLWTPASKRRYFPDGSDEVVAEPPQYFGKGWTSELGQYLLEIDMAPAFEGVQILFADGHTANFKKTGDTYVSDTPGNFNVITKEGDEFVLRDTDCQCALETKRFDSEGRLIALVDRNDNRINLIYDGDNLAAVENTAGRRIDFAVNADGRITKADLPENITLRYEYTDDMLTAFVDGRGNRTQYQYDDLGQMTGIISAKGHSVVQNSYDDEYRVSEQTVGESEMYLYSYANGQTTVSDSYGNAHVYHYDEELRLVRTDYPDGTAEEFTYDENLNRTGHQNQAGVQWSWTYDDKGNRLTADGPLGWHRCLGVQRAQSGYSDDREGQCDHRTRNYLYLRRQR